MGTRLAGRRAVVTGAADGMGKAIATLFAAEGASVLALDIQAELLADAHRGNSSIVTMAQDLGAPDAAGTIVAKARAELGGIDILINNAGIRGERSPIQEDTDDNWDHVLNVNLAALFRLSRAAAPLLQERDGGRIVNVSSIQGRFAAPTLGTYVVSKHGVLGLTRAFALDLGKFGITVNCIMPGFIETGLTRSMITDNPEIYNRVVSKVVLGRAGQPIEIANMALFFASAESSFVTGVCVPVDGGMSIW